MASNSSLFSAPAKPLVPVRRSLHPRNVTHAGTMSQGELIPVFLMDCLPQSDYTIDCGIALQSMALKLPMLNDVKCFVNFYKVNYRQMAHHFESMVSRGPFADIDLVSPRLAIERIFGIHPDFSCAYVNSPSTSSYLVLGCRSHINTNYGAIPSSYGSAPLAQRKAVYDVLGPGSLLDHFGMSWLPYDYTTAPDISTNNSSAPNSVGWSQWIYENPFNSNNDLEQMKSLHLSAFPFQAYKLVYKYYHLKKWLLGEYERKCWFGELYENDEVTRLDCSATSDFLNPEGVLYSSKAANALFYHGENADSGMESDHSDLLRELALTTKHYSDFPGDYFVDSRPSPVLGSRPEVSMPNEELALDFSKSVFTDTVPEGGCYVMLGHVNDAFDSHNWGLYATASSSNIDYHQPWAKTALEVLNRGVALTSGSSFNYDTLRVLQASTAWLEAHSRINWTYNNFMQSHFGSSARAPQDDVPEYLGGFSQPINTSAVYQTSSSTDTSALGDQAGRSFGAGSTGHIRAHFDDFGLIIGIAHILPETYYTHRIPREWTKTTLHDYYFPEFANLPPQEIRNHELANLYSASDYDSPSGYWNDNIFGYQGCWDEYRNSFNYISGELNGYYSDWRAWVQVRDFGRNLTWTNPTTFTGTTPALSRNFVSTKGNLDDTPFTTASYLPQYVFKFSSNVRCVQPIPSSADPMMSV